MTQILFSNCTLLDTLAGEFRPGHHVRVEADRIVEVSDRPLAANGAQVIEVGGRTLMPGLIDAHVHVTITTMNLAALERRPITLVMHEARLILERMLRRGFTTVRDAAGADYGLAQAVERGLIQGPRIFYSGCARGAATRGHPGQDHGVGRRGFTAGSGLERSVLARRDARHC